MNAWKYTDATETSVIRQKEDGTFESCSVEAIAEWIEAGGVPLPADEPDFEPLKVAELAKFRRDREAMLNRIAGIAVFSDDAAVAILKTFRTGLLDLPAHATVAAATDLVALKKAMKARYDALLVPLPLNLKQDFARVDA
ncbi:MAG: hypothetical protein V4706_02855 [Pseudomonadota bacterium]